MKEREPRGTHIGLVVTEVALAQSKNAKVMVSILFIYIFAGWIFEIRLSRCSTGAKSFSFSSFDQNKAYKYK